MFVYIIRRSSFWTGRFIPIWNVLLGWIRGGGPWSRVVALDLDQICQMPFRAAVEILVKLLVLVC